MAKKLKFLVPDFRFGVNTTVRRGRKWADAQPGDKIDLVAVDHKPYASLGSATIVSVAVVPFTRIPKEWLRLNHDCAARTFDGLFRAMKRAYGKDFQADELVTVLEFRLQGDDR